MLSATMSAGAGVHYDEAISGDIAANGAIPKFEFALGLNSVSGSRSDYVTFDSERHLYKLDFDPFEVHLTGDLRVKSATAAFKFTPQTENLAAFDMRWHVFDFPGLSVQFTDCFSVLAGGRCRIDSDGGPLGIVQKWGRTRNSLLIQSLSMCHLTRVRPMAVRSSTFCLSQSHRFQSPEFIYFG